MTMMIAETGTVDQEKGPVQEEDEDNDLLSLCRIFRGRSKRREEEDGSGSSEHEDEADSTNVIEQQASAHEVQWQRSEFPFRGHDIVLATNRQRGLAFRVWPAALALTQLVEQMLDRDAQVFKERVVVDLGAGPGLTGLIFSAVGSRVAITDLAHVVPQIQQSIEWTGAEENAIACEYSWGSSGIRLKQRLRNRDIDIMIAADVVYYKELFDLLIQAFDELATERTLILLSFVKRWKTSGMFFRALRKKYDVMPINFEKSYTDAYTRFDLNEDDQRDLRRCTVFLLQKKTKVGLEEGRRSGVAEVHETMSDRRGPGTESGSRGQNPKHHFQRCLTVDELVETFQLL